MMRSEGGVIFRKLAEVSTGNPRSLRVPRESATQALVRTRKKTLIGIGNVLGTTTRRLGIDREIDRWKLCGLWHELVGDAIARHSRPARWRGRTLIVRVEHSTWLQELTWLSAPFLEALRSKMPGIAVDRLRFEIGTLDPLPAERKAASAATPLALDQRALDAVQTATRTIEDPDLREAASRAMRKALAFPRTQKS
jgi:predicted nucleic acid-binding Zn ribbon protein